MYNFPYYRIKVQLAPESFRMSFVETRHFLDQFRGQLVLAVQVRQSIGSSIGRQPKLESTGQFTVQSRC